MTTKYNKSEIMKFAWKSFKANKELTFSECLKKAWYIAKTNPIGLKPNLFTFEQIYKSEKVWVKNYINQRINNPIDAEDLTSDIFIKVSIHLVEFNSDKSKLKTWLFNIIRNTLIDYMRKNKRKVTTINEYDVNLTETSYKLRKEVKRIEDYVNNEGENTFQAASSEYADETTNEAELMILIKNTLKAFNENHQKVCALQMQGYKYEEISETLNIPVNTVKTYVKRFREALKPKLERV